MKRTTLFLFILFLFLSCKNLSSASKSYIEVDASDEIVARAYKFAELYKDSDTKYKYGGQDAVRSIYIDCSGLVIMCYKYALVDTKYSLLESDMTANYIFKNASTKIEKEKLRQGDLIFMGELNSSEITHIAIFNKIENEQIYFIDSTQKDDIDGVTERSYSINDKRFKSFGIMRVKY